MAKGARDQCVKTDLDALLIALHVHLDDHVLPSRATPVRRGRPRLLTDAELVCLGGQRTGSPQFAASRQASAFPGIRLAHTADSHQSTHPVLRLHQDRSPPLPQRRPRYPSGLVRRPLGTDRADPDRLARTAPRRSPGHRPPTRTRSAHHHGRDPLRRLHRHPRALSAARLHAYIWNLHRYLESAPGCQAVGLFSSHPGRDSRESSHADGMPSIPVLAAMMPPTIAAVVSMSPLAVTQARTPTG